MCDCFRGVVNGLSSKTIESTVVRREHEGIKVGTAFYVGVVDSTAGLQQKTLVTNLPARKWNPVNSEEL